MHPDPILKYGIPSVTATSFGVCIVVANFAWGDGVWIVWFGHGLLVDNGKADQRRTIDSASLLDSISRLIQRMVRPTALRTLGRQP
jgi:hypothetical protein